MKLVHIDNGRPVTDSLIIAETFGKDHKRVLQDIRELECSLEFGEHNFVPISYKDSMNRDKPKYIITEQGFAFLVMGYTGKEAARFKEMYITQFNNMRQQLTDPFANLSSELKAVLVMDTKVQRLETKIEEIDNKVETQITLTLGEQRRIQKAVSARVYTLEDEAGERPRLFRELHREIKDRWGVPSYRDLIRKDMQSVIKYIDAWYPRKVS